MGPSEGELPAVSAQAGRETGPGRAGGTLSELPQAPDSIELRHLRAFVAVAEELNFTRAAERLFVTQPALSRQVRSLERLLGVDLLRRSTRLVELTVAGEALLDRARSMLSDLNDTVVTTRSVGGENQARLARLTRPVVESSRRGLDAVRHEYEAMNSQFPTPESVVARPVVAGGVSSLVYGETAAADPLVVYLHGGGYLVGSAFGSRPLAGVLAVATGRPVLVPDFRLAPEHPYPAAVDDVVSAYRWLVDGGTPADRLTMVGDSSGAAMCLSALLRLRSAGDALPGCVVLLSPWVDLECGFVGDASEADSQSQSLRDQLPFCVPAYLQGHPADAPDVNALHADLTGLPPMLIQVGTGDFVLREARSLVSRAREHGVAAELELYPVSTHGFHLFWSFLPEAARALERAGDFVRSVLDHP